MRPTWRRCPRSPVATSYPQEGNLMLNSKLCRLAALAAVTAGLTAPASPASADLPNREVVAASAHTVDDRGEAVVECPPGTRVVGAGADIAGIPAGSGSVILDDLIPTVDSVTAYAYEAEHGTDANWQIRAWAVCGSPHGSSVTSTRASVRNSARQGRRCHLPARQGRARHRSLDRRRARRGGDRRDRPDHEHCHGKGSRGPRRRRIRR